MRGLPSFSLNSILFELRKLAKIMLLLWSLAAIGGVFSLGELLRFFTKRNISIPYYRYASELISAFQLSACVFEVAVIGKFYSTRLGIIFSFTVLCLKNLGYILDGSPANPCGLLEGVCIKSKKPWFIDFVIKVLLQLIGALLAFPVMRLIWQVTASELHFKQLSNGLSSTLQVSIIFGFAIECVTTFFVTMADFLTRGRLRKFNPVVRALVCLVICFALTGTTGVWMNPALATVHTFMFALKGKELLLEHVFVFWVGPMIGTLAAIGVDSKLHQHEPKPNPIAKTILKQIRKNGLSVKKKPSKKPKKMGVENRKMA